MKSVKENTNTIIIKNSKFITHIYPVNSIEEINTHLNKIKKTYHDATHICFAYILDNLLYETDDGEPSKTAGLPILQVLERQELNHVLCIVVRYFGKIKLGANGLIRAYSKSATLCIENNVCSLIGGYSVVIEFPYSLLKKVDYLCKDSIIVEKSFNAVINYKINIKKELLEEIKSINEVDIISIKSIYLTCE